LRGDDRIIVDAAMTPAPLLSRAKAVASRLSSGQAKAIVGEILLGGLGPADFAPDLATGFARERFGATSRGGHEHQPEDRRAVDP